MVEMQLRILRLRVRVIVDWRKTLARLLWLWRWDESSKPFICQFINEKKKKKEREKHTMPT